MVAVLAGGVGWVVMAKLPDTSIWAAKSQTDVAVRWRQRIMAQDFQCPSIRMTRGLTPAQSNAMALPALSAHALMSRGRKPRLFPIAEQEVQSAAVNKEEVTRVGTLSMKAVWIGVLAGALTERRWQMRQIKARTGDKSTEEAFPCVTVLPHSPFFCVANRRLAAIAD